MCKSGFSNNIPWGSLIRSGGLLFGGTRPACSVECPGGGNSGRRSVVWWRAAFPQTEAQDILLFYGKARSSNRTALQNLKKSYTM